MYSCFSVLPSDCLLVARVAQKTSCTQNVCVWAKNVVGVTWLKETFSFEEGKTNVERKCRWTCCRNKECSVRESLEQLQNGCCHFHVVEERKHAVKELDMFSLDDVELLELDREEKGVGLVVFCRR